MAVDKLTRDEYAEEIGYAIAVVFSNPELREKFKTAYKENWTPEKFEAEVRKTNWYKNNDQYAREAYIAYKTGGADAIAYQKNAEIAVQGAATAVGVRLTPKQLSQLATRYNNEGWGKPGREQLLLTALSNEITPDEEGNLYGNSGNLQDDLRDIAEANGLRYSPEFYLSAARSVAANLSTPEDWQRDIRRQAASLYPSLADKINAGVSVKDIASSYINLMAQTFEVDPDQIPLTDPFIREALGGVDDKGNPGVMGMWEFQQKLRNDPRWMQTKQATDEMSNAAHSVLKAFGIMGS